MQDRGFFVGVKKSSIVSDGWGDNFKNILVISVVFWDVCCGGNV